MTHKLEKSLLPKFNQKLYYFDEKAVCRVVNFCQNYCKHIEGELAGQPFILEDWQLRDIIYPVFGIKRKSDGLRKHRLAWVEIPKKNGKALALETPIPTPTGWTTMGRIKIGDHVFDENGNPCNVVFVSSVMTNRQCYKVSFSDGTSVVADADHLWKTQTRKPENHHDIWTTKRISETLTIDYKGSEGYNHSIPITRKLNLPNINLPINPYILGVWLGDGHSKGARVTIGELDRDATIKEIERNGFIAKEGKTTRSAKPYNITTGDKSPGWTKRTLSAALRRTELIGNKHIPQQYLRSSQEQRVELMRGLMDTDGYVSKRGQCEFTTTSKLLRDGFLELARSLGYKPTIKTDRAKINGKDCGEKYRIQFWAFSEMSVFSLQRKTDRLKSRPHGKARSETLHIVGVDLVDSVPVRCIQVDSPSSLFLCGEGMVPTHNTTLLAALLIYLLCADGEKGGEIFCAANDKDQARIMFKLVCDMIKGSEFLNSRIQVLRNSCWHVKSNSFLRPISSDVAGKHGFNLSGLAIDEIHAFQNGIFWQTLTKGMSGRHQPLCFVLTNSGYFNTWPHEMHQRMRKIRDGVFKDETIHVVIYGLGDVGEDGEAFDIFDTKLWEKVNPNWKANKALQLSMSSDATEVRQMPSEENEFRRLRLGQWVGSSHAWISARTIEMCNLLKIVQENLRGRRAYGGLDLSGGGDFNAYTLLFPPDKEDKHFTWLLFSWIPFETMHKRSMNEHTNVMQWEKDEWVIALPGKVVGDYEPIAKKIKELHEMFDIRLTGYDAWRKWGIIPILERDGMPLEPYRQGPATMGVPIDELESLFLEQRINTGGNPVINWQMDNVMIYKDKNGNKWMDKSSSKDKIDGPVSLANAMCAYLHSEAEGEKPDSVYETRGIVTLEW